MLDELLDVMLGELPDELLNLKANKKLVEIKALQVDIVGL
jgi:hypothetical protein